MGLLLFVFCHEWNNSERSQRIFSYSLLQFFAGRLVTTKREELTHILDQLNIQVENPVAVLNQETSRNFLHNSNPNQKYKVISTVTLCTQFLSGWVKKSLIGPTYIVQDTATILYVSVYNVRLSRSPNNREPYPDPISIRSNRSSTLYYSYGVNMLGI